MSDPIRLAKIKLALDRELNELLEKDSFVDRVELTIRHCFESDIPTKLCVAKALDISESTLTRLLARSGTSYLKVKTNVIKDMSRLKIYEGLPLSEIAFSMGYNDQSAFTRAYKNWYGHAPGKDKPSRKHELSH